MILSKNRLAMKIIAFALFLAAIAHGSSLDESRIVGGSEAGPGQFPYQVSLRRKGRHFCGGSIIGSNWILTAAHCIMTMSGSETVVAGTNSLSSGGDTYHVARAIYHTKYNQKTLKNDIALIKTIESIRWNENVRPIQLNSQDINGGQLLTLSGWGLTKYPGKIPDKLMYAQLNSITVQDCQQKLASVNQVFTSQICTYTRVGQGTCRGDSGGPLVIDGAQAGIVSWGELCAKGVPDVHTRVSSYVDWIQAVMELA